MKTSILPEATGRKPRILWLVFSVLASWLGLTADQFAFAQTDMGEIQGRPAPVY